MRILTIFSYFITAVLCFSVQKALLSENERNDAIAIIPGHTNARLCSDPDTDIFYMERVALVPNPPIPGLYMTVQIWGTFREGVEQDAYVDFNLTVDGEVSIHYPFFLCDTYHLDTWQWLEGKNPGRSCPPRRGWAEITYTVLVPTGRSRDGNWTARAAFLTDDERSLFCLEGWVMWPPE